MLSGRSLVVLARVFVFALALLARPHDSVAEGELVVVVNASNKENLGLGEMKRLFLGDTTFWSGNLPVKVFVRPADSPPAEVFFRAIQMAPARFKRLWQEKQLSGQGIVPETVAAVSALVPRIAGEAGGIGFALSDELPASPAPGVRIVPLR